MRVLCSSGKVLNTFRFVSLSLLATITSSLSGQTTSPTPLDGFDPNANSIVTQTIVQPDGKILVAGYFSSMQPNGANGSTNAPYVARLNIDGSVDSTFQGSADNSVYSMQLLANGQILIAGIFKNVDGQAQAGVARLNANGSLDATFRPTFVGVYGQIQVYGVAGQPDGKVIAVGSFTQADGVARNKIARFNTDGSIDAGFDPEANATILAVAVEPSDNKILIGGAFTTLAKGSVTRNYIARLNTDGSVDANFNPDANGSVDAFAFEANGEIDVGGAFTTFEPNPDTASATSQRLNYGRLYPDGTLDGNFVLNPNAKVTGITIQQDGKLILSGGFTATYPVNATSSSSTLYIARINTDGTVDNSFEPGPNYNVNCAAVQPNGQIVIGGYFNAVQPSTSIGSTTRNFIARLNADGSLDATFAPDTVGRVLTSAVATDGTTYVGGTFTSINGTTANYFARLTSTGTLYQLSNSGWTPPILDGTISAIEVQSNGQVVIAGNFTHVNTTPRGYIARLNADGSLDSWDPGANGPIYALLPTGSSGQLIIAGAFTTLTAQGDNTTGETATAKSYIARLNSDDTVDTTWNPVPDGQIYALGALSDGSIILGGNFDSVYGDGDVYSQTRTYLAKLLSNGRVEESTFNPTPNGAVYTLAIQKDDEIILGGAFTALEPALLGEAAQTQIAYPTTRKYIARVTAGGVLDGPTYYKPTATGYDPEASSTVLSIAIANPSSATSDAIVGGNFTSFWPNSGVSNTGTVVLRNYLAWITSTGTVDTSITTQTNNQVGSVTVTPSGQVLIGGLFTTVTPNGGTASSRNHFARLNANGAIDTSFTVGAVASGGGTVQALALQPNGQLLVGGSFATLGGSQSANLARFNGAGFADLSFNPDPNGAVKAIAIPALGSATPINSAYAAWLTTSGNLRQPFSTDVNGEVTSFAVQKNGAFLVGGLFASFGGSMSPNLVRFNADGSPDTNFNPNIQGEVLSVALAAPDASGNQAIYICGDFTSVGGVTVDYLAELDSSGNLITSFNPTANAEVRELYVQPSDGKIVIGGTFTSLAPTSVGGATGTTVTREDIARLNTDGTVDTGFNPNVNGGVYAICPIPSAGGYYIGGAFTSLQPNGTGTGVARNYAAKINMDGTVDTNWNPFPDNIVDQISILPNGEILMAGEFSTLEQGDTAANSVARTFLAVVNNSNGSLDAAFNTIPNSTILSMVVQPDGYVLLAGSFNAIQVGSATAVTRNFVARIDGNAGSDFGQLDSSFDPNVNSTVNTVTLYGDGSVLIGGNFTQLQPGSALIVGGDFTTVAGQNIQRLVRLSIDGSPDTTYTPNPDSSVNAVLIQSDTKAIVAGNFLNIGGAARPYLARINTNGSVDATYAASLTFSGSGTGGIYAAALQPDGKVVIGGNFSTVNGTAIQNLARINTDGSLDSSFHGGANGTVYALQLQPNGGVIAGGAFTSIGGGSAGYIAKLTTGGTIDGSFSANANGTINAIALEADGSIVVGGTFSSIAGGSRANFARLTSTGGLDTNFQADTNATVQTIAVQPDGKPVFGGSFTTVAGLARNLFARLSPSSQTTNVLGVTADETTILWTLGGSSPQLAAVYFDISTDGLTWTTIGAGTRVGSADQWTIQIPSTPSTSTFYVRGRGVVPTSTGASQSLIEVTSEGQAGVNSTGQ